MNNSLEPSVKKDIEHYKKITLLHHHLYQPEDERTLIVEKTKIDYTILTGLSASIFNISMMDSDYPPEQKDFPNKGLFVRAVREYSNIQLFRSWYFNIFLDLGRDVSNFYKPAIHRYFIPDFIGKNENYMVQLKDLLTSTQINEYFDYDMCVMKFNNSSSYDLILYAKQHNDLSKYKNNIFMANYLVKATVDNELYNNKDKKLNTSSTKDVSDSDDDSAEDIENKLNKTQEEIKNVMKEMQKDLKKTNKIPEKKEEKKEQKKEENPKKKPRIKLNLTEK